MSYAEISDVQKVLNKETLTSWEQERIQFFLDSTTGVINNIIGDVSLSDKIERINYCDVCNSSFLLRNINVTRVLEIDGKSYTGSVGVDYIVEYSRKVTIIDLNLYLTLNNFNSFEIKYESGYDPIPKDIVLAQSLMVAGEISLENGKEVSSYKVGDVSVNFETGSSQLGKTTIDSILSKYKIF